MTYHFIGLGGIGMSALARILLQQGHKVQGSDINPSTLLQQLQKEGAKVHIGHNANVIQDSTTIIYSSDINNQNSELLAAKEKKLPLLHRSDLLHFLMQNKKSLLVTGSHGKTTTTALLAAVVIEAGLDPSFVIGGILQSLKTNGQAGKGEYFVAEADESDGSFLKTPPFGAIVTNLDNDHLNYWGSIEKLQAAFAQFCNMVKTKELLVWCADDPALVRLCPQGVSYGFSSHAEWKITSFQQTDKGIAFDLGSFRNIELPLMGRHNALNAAAVFALCIQLKVPESAIRKAFRLFSGTARRLEYKKEVGKVAFYDDYGHHPTEIKATISALRAHIRERRLVVVFQPHRFTRVADHFDSFCHCFSEADEVIMTDIYSAGEAPIDGITSERLFATLKKQCRATFIPRDTLATGAAELIMPLDVVLTLGAGDVTKANGEISTAFANRNKQMTVGVLYGGTSAEHAVSEMSAKNIISGLNLDTYKVKTFPVSRRGAFGEAVEKIVAELVPCDVCIPVFHGPEGEDGMFGAFLQTLGIPYVGCDYQSAAVCMQKAWTKHVAIHHGVPTGPFIEVYRNTAIDALPFPFPVWVKPTRLGSSIGVSRAVNREELEKSMQQAFLYDDAILIEQEIIGRQIEFSLLGNTFIQVALPGEIINHGAFVAYDKKYGPTAMEIAVPAPISEEEKEEGYALAKTMYQACGCQGLARIDFFLSLDGQYWFNEINPFPGFTNTSAFPKMWTQSGKTMEQLVDEMLVLALHKYRRKTNLLGAL